MESKKIDQQRLFGEMHANYARDKDMNERETKSFP
jgi:hypothetical protein